jgi:hypothetical protein
MTKKSRKSWLEQLAEEANKYHDKVVTAMRSAIQDACVAGTALNKAKNWLAEQREQGRNAFVEVPLSAALEDEALEWVMEAARAGRYERSTGRPAGGRGRINVILVPWDDYTDRIQISTAESID